MKTDYIEVTLTYMLVLLIGSGMAAAMVLWWSAS